MKKGLLVFAFSFFTKIAFSQVIISEIYGAGGNSGATWRNDYVVLYNTTSSPVNLTGWSLQYASATGTSWSNKVDLTITIAANKFALIQLASSGANGATFPTNIIVAQTGSINLSATAGKLALFNTTTVFTGGSNPVGNPNLVDFVGFGTTANANEGGTNAPAPSATSSIRRIGGTQDTNVNGTDFVVVSGTFSPLPVTYTSIQARSLENHIELAWGTSAEVGAEKFEIERSNNALEFYKIGQVMAQGDSRNKLNYSFIDNSPIEGINYYRLKQIDLDGKYEYSKIVSTVFGKEAEAFEILGNPTQSSNITLLLKNLPIEQLRLFSATGQNIPFESTASNNRLTIQPKTSLSSGIYYLVLENANKRYFKKLAIE